MKTTIKTTIGSKAFSLVETVLALGVFAFCIVVVAGLLISGINAARSVANETNAVNLANSIFGAWQMQSNRAVPLSITNMVTNLPALSEAPVAGSQNVYFFDYAGRQLGEEGAASAALKMLYGVQVVEEVDPALEPVLPEVVLDFYWPAQATVEVAQHRQFRRIFY